MRSSLRQIEITCKADNRHCTLIRMNRITSLFRDFAELSAVDFLKEHGPLPIGQPGMEEAELLKEWERERGLMRAALQRWETIQQLELGRDDGSRIVDARKKVASIEALMFNDWRTSREKQRSELAGLINEQLTRLVTLKLSGDLTSLQPVSSRAQLGALWLQLARAVAGQGCAWCGASLDDKRAGARFCSSGCKLKGNRNLKRTESIPASIPARPRPTKGQRKRAVRRVPNRP